MTFIKVKNVVKRYKNTTIKFPNLLLKNRITVLLGKNGTGKTTLLKAIAHHITYDGEITHDNSLMYKPDSICLPLDLTVSQFLKGLNDLATENAIEPLMKKYQLDTKKDELINALSKGMKAKVSLISVFHRNVDLYLLDEPYTGLDDKAIKHLNNFIKSSRALFIIATHHKSLPTFKDRDVITL
ncbi:MAG: ATP-binding cassette domain-containing protein [Candidatus Izimaplasma sp.]|nr:ATP-binding cassette domain-containing protein [Candidatus Izimaplasma bacterium]